MSGGSIHERPGVREVTTRLRAMANPADAAGMARFGIRGKKVLGISIPSLRSLAKEIGRDHRLAMQLWRTSIHEARILAAFVDDPDQVTEEQMEEWVAGFDSWDVCDQVCGSLFDRTPFAWDKAVEWAGRDEEFVKRAGFALMAYLAVHDKEAPDRAFVALFPVIRGQATDDRTYVKKGVNWALRQIGKRNERMHASALAEARRIGKIDSRAARWIASDAIRDLQHEDHLRRLGIEGR
jgi:3-methyladenine DNA glycosylase AlkD